MALPDVCIETPRLRLRTPRMDDFEGYAALMADPDAARFIGGQMPRPAAWRKFMTLAGAWALQGFAMFSVVERVSGDWIGNVGPWQPEGWPGTEVGWSILRPYWGRGYAREAAEVSIDYAFDTLGWTRVIHTIQAGNAPSIALAERLGSTYTGNVNLPPPHEDIEAGIWAQSRDQWRARSRA
ncbi:GNAT family N-acetyltransferase [Luteimonas pelagia]